MLNSPDRIKSAYVVKEIGNAGKRKLKNNQVEDFLQDQTEEQIQPDTLDNILIKGDELTNQLSDKLITILANTQLVFLMIGKEDLRKYLSFVEDAARESENMLKEFQELIKQISDAKNS
ncbi:hypothetical protein GF312_02315 [Candidatus Poribacteria bacterium]|nr:hypothetical protein [Candidatus Poribacteria bacterium]